MKFSVLYPLSVLSFILALGLLMFAEPVLDFVLGIDRKYLNNHVDAYTDAAYQRTRIGSLILFLVTGILGVVCYKLSIKAQTKSKSIGKVVGFILQGVIIAIAIFVIGLLVITSMASKRIF